jgi:hypothetical protein
MQQQYEQPDVVLYNVLLQVRYHPHALATRTEEFSTSFLPNIVSLILFV